MTCMYLHCTCMLAMLAFSCDTVILLAVSMCLLKCSVRVIHMEFAIWLHVHVYPNPTFNWP